MKTKLEQRYASLIPSPILESCGVLNAAKGDSINRGKKKEDLLLARWVTSQKLGPLAPNLLHLIMLVMSDIPYLQPELVHRRVELLKNRRHRLKSSSHVHDSRCHVGIEPFLPRVIRLAP